MIPDARLNPQRRLKDIVYKTLFEEVPFNVAVIDREYNIVEATETFDLLNYQFKALECSSKQFCVAM